VIGHKISSHESFLAMTTQIEMIPSKSVARRHERAVPTARSVQLDVLRAVAILLVVGGHISISLAKPDGIVGSIAWILRQWGAFGVPLFFTLSGYLVGGLLISELRRHGQIDVSRFLIRRGLKIYPAYFVFLAYLVTMPTLEGTVPLSTLLSDYWANVFFLQNYIGPNPAGHTWSLAVEEHFYITLPFLLLALLRLGLMTWIAPLCLLAPLAGTVVRTISAAAGDPYIHNFPNTMAATHLCLDGLLVGVGVRALAEFSPDRFAGLRTWRWPLLIAGPVILATVALPLPPFMGVALDRILPISAISATALLVGVLHLRLAGWVSSAVAWIGKYSYGIYLWHVTIIGFVTRVILTRIPGDGQTAHWVFAAIAITVTAILFGAAMSRLVEWPVLALRDRLFPSRSA
jgi:peptidoglycan/LPS O-acetylase OafA/YrhL